MRGGGPSARETDLLSPFASVPDVTALLLTGGSAFGLSAAAGVERWCEERGLGHETGPARVPIVPAAVIFDLGITGNARRPGPDDAYAACAAAGTGPHPVGSVGAGTGATVGKLLGQDGWCKGGLGAASVRLRDGTTVAALAVVNAFGDVLDERGEVLAGAWAPGPGLRARGPVRPERAAGAPAPGGAPEHHARRRGHRRAAGQGRGRAGGAHGHGRRVPRRVAGAHAVRRRRGLLPGHGPAARPPPSRAGWPPPRSWPPRSATGCAGPPRCAACPRPPSAGADGRALRRAPRTSRRRPVASRRARSSQPPRTRPSTTTWGMVVIPVRCASATCPSRSSRPMKTSS